MLDSRGDKISPCRTPIKLWGSCFLLFTNSARNSIVYIVEVTFNIPFDQPDSTGPFADSS
jgi:hypothetical protein